MSQVKTILMSFSSYFTSKISLRQKVSHRNVFLWCAFVVLLEVNIFNTVVAVIIKIKVDDGVCIMGAEDFLAAPSPATVDSLSFQVFLCSYQLIIGSFFSRSQWPLRAVCGKPLHDNLKIQTRAGPE